MKMLDKMCGFDFEPQHFFSGVCHRFWVIAHQRLSLSLVYKKGSYLNNDPTFDSTHILSFQHDDRRRWIFYPFLSFRFDFVAFGCLNVCKKWKKRKSIILFQVFEYSPLFNEWKRRRFVRESGGKWWEGMNLRIKKKKFNNDNFVENYCLLYVKKMRVSK